jgi:hypothetical protein
MNVRLAEPLGSPRPLRPRRFRRDLRFPPYAVPRSLALTGSSPRELRSSSESSASHPPSLSPAPAPSLGLRSLFATSPTGVRAAGIPSPAAFPSSAFRTPATVCSANRLVGPLGCPLPLRPRRFRRDLRFVPFAVRRSLSQSASSPRELRSPPECSVSCPPLVSLPTAPSLGFAVPLRDITEKRPCLEAPKPRCLSVRGVSHAHDGFLRLSAGGFISPHSHVQGSLFRGCCLTSSRVTSSVTPCPLAVGAEPLTVLPLPPRSVVSSSGLSSARESVAAASAINRYDDPIPS